eukprot:11395_1
MATQWKDPYALLLARVKDAHPYKSERDIHQITNEYWSQCWSNFNSNTFNDIIHKLQPKCTSIEQEIDTKHDEQRQDETMVSQLLHFDRHQWDFDNLLVDVYRAKAYKRDHHKVLPQPQQYCFPEYLSILPLPELPGGKFIVKIHLPRAFSTYRRYSHIRIAVDFTRASDAIKQCVSKLDHPHNNSRHFILKVAGQESYMYGRRKIIDYEAIRDAIRDADDVEIVLIACRDFKERVNAAKQEQKEHIEHFKTAYPVRITANADHLLQHEEALSSIQIDSFSQFKALEYRPSFCTGLYGAYTIKAPNAAPSVPRVINLYECEWFYRLKIVGLTNVAYLPRFKASTMTTVYVVAELWIGDMIFDHATLRTKSASPMNDIRWGQWLSSRHLRFSQIPREAILCFMVMALTSEDSTTSAPNTDRCLAWCRIPLVDHQHRLRTGQYLLNMWEIPEFTLRKRGPKVDPFKHRPFRYRGSTRDKHIKHIEPEQCQLFIEFDEFEFDVVATQRLPINHGTDLGEKLQRNEVTKLQKNKITNLINKTPLETLDIKEKRLVWQTRDLLWHDPSALPVFLRSVNWTHLSHVAEAHKYLNLWSPPKRPEDALEYLDYWCADTVVREKAISWLEDVYDDDLSNILLQLVQCLKYEPHHDSALSMFLLRRSLANPYQIGHFFFWYLFAEYHDLQYCERFGLLIEEYLLHAAQHTKQLFTQNLLLNRLKHIAAKIKRSKTMDIDTKQTVTKRLFAAELTKLNHDIIMNQNPIQMPLNPRYHVKKLVVDKCRYMSSKTLPLWLVFANVDKDAADRTVLLKTADLRQDMLTLQVINVMDRLWLDNKLDLHPQPYSVLVVGHNVGMIQIVPNAVTVNALNVEYGGAFDQTTIDKYWKKQHGCCDEVAVYGFIRQIEMELLSSNTEATAALTTIPPYICRLCYEYCLWVPNERLIKKVRDRFVQSCAAYCIATYVLGIGDRHSDHFMVDPNGQFFHIDFRHFLGNFKSKLFSFRRERSPLKFTQQMKYAIDVGTRKCPLYDAFLQNCVDAYLVLRRRSRLLLVLFSLMISAGLPELTTHSDIRYLQSMLNLQYDSKKATRHIHKLIASSLKDRTRMFDSSIHVIKHL